MKIMFLKKYRDYCRGGDFFRDDIFCMTQKEDGPLEGYLEHFLFTQQKSKHNHLRGDPLELFFLRIIDENCLDALNLMVGGDVTQATWDDMYRIARNYS